MRAISANKVKHEQLFAQLEQTASSEPARRLARAMRRSCRLMAEDVLRETGYMLPQSENVQSLLKSAGRDAVVKNWGKGSETTDHGASRIDDVIAHR